MLREWLEEEIERVRRRRDLLYSELCCLKSSVAYYDKKGNLKRARELKKELVKVKKEYEEVKDEFWRLVRR